MRKCTIEGKLRINYKAQVWECAENAMKQFNANCPSPGIILSKEQSVSIYGFILGLADRPYYFYRFLDKFNICILLDLVDQLV